MGCSMRCLCQMMLKNYNHGCSLFSPCIFILLSCRVIVSWEVGARVSGLQFRMPRVVVYWNSIVYNKILASCPWGPVTANRVDLLTGIYVIYMETHTSHRSIARCFMPLGPLVAAGERVTHRRKARKYIRMWKRVLDIHDMGFFEKKEKKTRRTIKNSKVISEGQELGGRWNWKYPNSTSKTFFPVVS